jgi:hypothetical protein
MCFLCSQAQILRDQLAPMREVATSLSAFALLYGGTSFF